MPSAYEQMIQHNKKHKSTLQQINQLLELLIHRANLVKLDYSYNPKTLQWEKHESPPVTNSQEHLKDLQSRLQQIIKHYE